MLLYVLLMLVLLLMKLKLGFLQISLAAKMKVDLSGFCIVLYLVLILQLKLLVLLSLLVVVPLMLIKTLLFISSFILIFACVRVSCVRALLIIVVMKDDILEKIIKSVTLAVTCAYEVYCIWRKDVKS